MFKSSMASCLVLVCGIVGPQAMAGDLKKGTYEGTAKVTTNFQGLSIPETGNITIKVHSIDQKGAVEVTLEWSNGLDGKAACKGTLDAKGVLRLKDTALESMQVAGMTMTTTMTDFRATAKGKRLSGKYTLVTTGEAFGFKNTIKSFGTFEAKYDDDD
jgi:hypothetical protein